jgi:hypothetical protein
LNIDPLLFEQYHSYISCSIVANPIPGPGYPIVQESFVWVIYGMLVLLVCRLLQSKSVIINKLQFAPNLQAMQTANVKCRMVNGKGAVMACCVIGQASGRDPCRQ